MKLSLRFFNISFFKRLRVIPFVFSLLGPLVITFNCLAKAQLLFAVNPSSAAQQEIYHILAKNFETLHPEIEVKVTSRLLEEHKSQIINYLETGKPFADVFTGYAGAQLNALVARNLALPLSEFWNQNQLDAEFIGISKAAASIDNIVYALPLNYYQWGFYYKKSVFANLSIDPPTNWQELFRVISTLKAHNIVPISLSGQSRWSLAAWFDYLDLRLNGLDFHIALLSGNIPFTDPRVHNIFTHWKQLIDAQAFDVENVDLTWKQSLPLLYRNYTAMILMGNFFIAHMPDSMKSDFNFIPFPNLIKDMPRYEDVPFDIAVVAKSTKEPAAALAFLKFLAASETQSIFSNYVGKISPNLHAKVADQYFIVEGKRHIESAAGATQYFDRDTPQAFSSAAHNVFYDFVNAPQEINETVEKLEILRGQFLINRDK